jgi:hypothetical protein
VLRIRKPDSISSLQGNVGSAGAGSRNIQNMGGSLTNLGSDLGEPTPAKGREAQVCTK